MRVNWSPGRFPSIRKGAVVGLSMTRLLGYVNIWRILGLAMAGIAAAMAGRKMVAARQAAATSRQNMETAKQAAAVAEAGTVAAIAHAAAVAHGEAAMAHEAVADDYAARVAAAKEKAARLRRAMGK